MGELIPQTDRDVMTANWAEGTPMQDASPEFGLVADYFHTGNNDNFWHLLTFNASAAGLFSEAGLLHGLIAHE